MSLPVAISLALGCAAACLCAPEPQWIGASAAPPADEQTVFTRSFDLAQAPGRALVRVTACERYRLVVNGIAVGVGDTPWDAETHDVTHLLTAGSNALSVAAQDDVPRPANCWVWMRRDLPAPGHFTHLRLTTRNARADEWLYLEVVDTSGNSSGLYCSEKGHRDLILGSGGAEAEHVIDLAVEPTIEYRPHVGDRPGCDFEHIASIGIRMDRKDARTNPTGQVDFGDIRLVGDAEVDLSDPTGWRLEPGSGEWRRSNLQALEEGGVRLQYDFTPASDPQVAVDLQAWGEAAEPLHIVTGPDWLANGRPARVIASPLDVFSWTRLSVTGPDEAPSPPLQAGVMLDLGGTDRCVEGQPVTASVHVWAREAMPRAQVHVRAQSWSGAQVFEADLPVTWDGAEGRAEFQVPELPRGVYRFDAAVPGVPAQERHFALAVLAPGEKRLSSIFDTLTPLAGPGPLRGVDLNWGDSAALLLSIRDQGVNFLQVHLSPQQLDNGEYRELLAFCKATGVHFALNNETSNWVAVATDPSGRNRFDAPGGCHRWDIEAPALDAAAATGLFEGVVYDEGEHMQLCRNFYAKLPDMEHRRPYLVETTGMALPQAYDAFLGAAGQVREYHRTHGARMVVESVFPALWHPLARAGVTLCPKLLKEDVYPAVLALALGAAKQYKAELWFTPDLWLSDRFPGHSVEDYAAALRLAHNAGVDNVYTEFFCALCRQRDAAYEFTQYGLALRDFLREYVPAHPRRYDYRDYEPEVAIIRFPDSDWGQASCYYWKTLYGAENLPPTAETGEWMQVLSLLTRGGTDPRAVNSNSGVYPRYCRPVAPPCPPTAVYDHLAGDEELRGVQTVFLCGITLSDKTLAAVRRRVNEGAVCFSPARLCPPDVRAQATDFPARVGEGTGAWVIVPGFGPEDLGDYASLLPEAGATMRLRFRGQQVTVGG